MFAGAGSCWPCEVVVCGRFGTPSTSLWVKKMLRFAFTQPGAHQRGRRRCQTCLRHVTASSPHHTLSYGPPPLARTRFVEKRHRSARLRIAEVMSHQMQVLGVFWGLFRCGAELARVSPPAVIICCRLHAVTLLWRSARELWPSG